MIRAAACAVLLFWALPATATGTEKAATTDTIRIATFHTELDRDGPGLLLRDITRGQAPDIDAVLATIVLADADVLLLQGIDHDAESRALTALRDRLSDAGLLYPFFFAPPSNRGVIAEIDLDGDGRISLPDDGQGYGDFRGQGAMALLSRFPIMTDSAHDFTAMIWSHLPDARLPVHADGTPFPSRQARVSQRLSTTGHWIAPIATPAGRLDILAFHATPPVFDGPEDRNGLRNADEISFWQHYLDGRLGIEPFAGFAILGVANMDPDLGVGNRAALAALLSDPRLIDPAPKGAKGRATVDWDTVTPPRQRVDYVLPSSSLIVTDAGIVWPSGPDAGRHGLVWADIALPSIAATAAAMAASGGVD